MFDKRMEKTYAALLALSSEYRRFSLVFAIRTGEDSQSTVPAPD